MPGQDRTGPRKLGPKTGCRRGFCSTGQENTRSSGNTIFCTAPAEETRCQMRQGCGNKLRSRKRKGL